MTVPSSLHFSAVLLAGGLSSRMGRDKAGVVFQGQPLWQRQLATLREMKPIELFISGRPDGPYFDSGVPTIFDAKPHLGPLGGIAAALEHAVTPFVLVLAIDLPQIDADFLQHLLLQAQRLNTGAVPWIDRHYEPLAAVYPRAALSLVEECLASDDRSMQGFARQACRAGLLLPLHVGAELLPLFRNLNRPEDLD